jgi:mRNA interferase HigB
LHHIISRKKLREFWGRHPRARRPLEVWYQIARHADWESFDDVKAEFPHADQYKRFVIFDVGGNKYRLIAVIHYNRRKVFVRHVLTHADYARGDWKNE